MLILSLLASVPDSAARTCSAEAEIRAPAAMNLRGHSYALIGACGALPVYRTASTDSTFLDRAEADRAVILVTDESVDPTTAEDAWPAPSGNLYFSYPFPGTRQQAQAAISQTIADWWAAHAPEVATTEGWEGDYGAHRAGDGRFLTGLALDATIPGGHVPIGVDIHLGATAAQYDALGAAADHVSLATLTGRTFDVDAALWAILSGLYDRAGAVIRQSLFDEAAAHIFWELSRHGVTEEGGAPVTAQSIGRVVEVRGFARSSIRGAIVHRATALAQCDVAEQWPEDVEGRFVTVRGTLGWLPADYRVPDPPDIDFYGTAVLQLRDCAVHVGVQDEDVPRAQWRALRRAGVRASLGDVVTVSGVAGRRPGADGMFLVDGALGIELVGCGAPGEVTARGTLGYRPPHLLEGVGPREQIAAVATGLPAWFVLEGCTEEE